MYHSSAAPDHNGHVEAHGDLLGDSEGEQTFGRPYRAANAVVIVVRHVYPSSFSASDAHCIDNHTVSVHLRCPKTACHR